MKTFASVRKTGMPPEAALTAYWSLPPEKLLSALRATDKGLQQADADSRLRQYGLNALKRNSRRGRWFCC